MLTEQQPNFKLASLNFFNYRLSVHSHKQQQLYSLQKSPSNCLGLL
ncbi:hypothetical protein PPRY_b0495 [Pseudoalteromonas prydzensis ACAM 620]|nr:hypothetical protein [Pseudoalteromonas prydzensis ACAM 620]